MKKRLITLLAPLALATSLSAGELTEKFDRVYDFRAGMRLAVDNENGAVSVKTWDNNKVQVQATKRARGRNDAAIRQALRDIVIDVRTTGDSLVIDTKTPDEGMNGFFDWLEGNDVDASVDYLITVPRSLRLDVETVNGSVTVNDVSGDIQLETTNGQIRVNNGAGTLRAETTNGAIKAALRNVAPNSNMRLATTNGAIDLTVPATIGAQLRASTTNGAIRTDIPVLTKSSGDNRLVGQLNNGGGTLDLTTTNGSITIRKM